MQKQTRSSIKPVGIKPIGGALDELVRSLGIKKKLQEYEAVLQWSSVVGEHVARMSSATTISRGVMYVKVTTSTWRNELSLRKNEIILKLNAVLGEEVVKDIKFQ